MTKIIKIKLSISNCYLVMGEKNILVDTGSPNEAEKIINTINKFGITMQDISLIIHTHGHSDHCGSTKAMVNLFNIPTLIHKADYEMTKNGKNYTIKYTKFISRFIRPFVDKSFAGFEADYIIEDSLDLSKFGIKGQLVHTPGHTQGSISLIFDNNEAIIGDTLMGGYFGGLVSPQLPDFHYFADNLEEVKKSVQKLLTFNCHTFYVGHGGYLTKKTIENFMKNKF